MARARNLKPGFFRNADLAEFDPWARLLFAGLWLLADREGRLEDKPKQIKIELFPCDTLDIDATLQDLADRAPDMLRRYEVDGKRYLQVVNFRKHQNPHKDEKPSTIPDPAGNLPPPPATKKPGASTVQTPDKHTGTLFAPELHGAGTVPIRLNPESCILNPDPLNLNPSTHKPDPPGDAEPDLSTIPVHKSVCDVLEQAGIVGAYASSPELGALIAGGADVAMFESAAQTAVTKKNQSFPYVLGIVRNRLAQASGAPAPGATGPPWPAPGQSGGVGQGVGLVAHGGAVSDLALQALQGRDARGSKPPPGFFARLRGFGPPVAT